MSSSDRAYLKAPLIVLAGPTGVGKTDISLRVAEAIGAEIVSADSRLFYRGMDIGTAKPGVDERWGIPHHMIDVAEPGEDYTCKRFEVEARQIIRDIVGHGRPVIAVGGSGLYIKALLEGIFEGPGEDSDLRRTLAAEAAKKGKDHIWRMLVEVDPEKAAHTDPENLARVIRAIEVFRKTGTPMSQLEKQAEPIGVPFVKVGLNRSRKELYERIDRRVDQMMKLGFLDEVKGLAGRGLSGTRAVKGSLGYSELLAHLDGVLTLERAVSLIKRNTRRFAKRQLTWFKKDPAIVWIDLTGRSDVEAIGREVLSAARG